MVWRILRFLVGAGIAGGGGYLVWTHRGEAPALWPFSMDTAPWLLIAGLGLLVIGMVTFVSSLLPAASAQKRAEKSARREAHLKEADSFYAERARAVDRDWRSGDLPPEPAPPTPSPSVEPLPEPEPAAEPLRSAAISPSAALPPEPAQAAQTSAAQDPAAAPPSAAAQTLAAAPAMATSTGVAGPSTGFPATITLQAIPASAVAVDPLPPHTAPIAAPEPARQPAPAPAPTVEVALAAVTPAPPSGPASAASPMEAIRKAIASSRLEDADRMLSSERSRLSSDGADPLALAELTGLAGDHAAAAGRLGGAKWLWRLSLQRFAAANAIATPAARAVSERLRMADQ
jgi:hypothetical protein